MSLPAISKNKKRLILPLINSMISKLVDMSPQAAALEYSDNAKASLELRKKFLEFKDKDVVKFHEFILELRKEINSRPKRASLNNLKKTRNDVTTQLD